MTVLQLEWSGKMALRKQISNTVTADFARRELDQLIERTRGARERFVIDEPGGSVAVILGFEDYLESIASAAELLRGFGEEAARNGSSALTMDEIDSEIADVREQLKAAG